jgi:hypothetical protein
MVRFCLQPGMVRCRHRIVPAVKHILSKDCAVRSCPHLNSFSLLSSSSIADSMAVAYTDVGRRAHRRPQGSRRTKVRRAVIPEWPGQCPGLRFGIPIITTAAHVPGVNGSYWRGAPAIKRPEDCERPIDFLEAICLRARAPEVLERVGRCRGRDLARQPKNWRINEALKTMVRRDPISRVLSVGQ